MKKEKQRRRNCVNPRVQWITTNPTRLFIFYSNSQHTECLFAKSQFKIARTEWNMDPRWPDNFFFNFCIHRFDTSITIAWLFFISSACIFATFSLFLKKIYDISVFYNKMNLFCSYHFSYVAWKTCDKLTVIFPVRVFVCETNPKKISNKRKTRTFHWI